MLQVINIEGRRFNVRIVFEGDSYGLDGYIKYIESSNHGFRKNDPLVEFYDDTYSNINGFDAVGQFTGGRYYFSTLCEGELAGLQLDGGIAVWNISKKNRKEVIDYVTEKIAQRQKQNKISL